VIPRSPASPPVGALGLVFYSYNAGGTAKVNKGKKLYAARRFCVRRQATHYGVRMFCGYPTLGPSASEACAQEKLGWVLSSLLFFLLLLRTVVIAFGLSAVEQA